MAETKLYALTDHQVELLTKACGHANEEYMDTENVHEALVPVLTEEQVGYLVDSMIGGPVRDEIARALWSCLEEEEENGTV